MTLNLEVFTYALCRVMNLVLMVLFVGYVNFVSVIRPEKEEDWPKWMGYLDYSGLKIQLLGSIIAVLVASIGLVLCVPITTAVAVALADGGRRAA